MDKIRLPVVVTTGRGFSGTEVCEDCDGGRTICVATTPAYAVEIVFALNAMTAPSPDSRPRPDPLARFSARMKSERRSSDGA